MVLVRFKNKEEHKEVKMKLKEMKEFIEDLCYMIEERAEEDADYRMGGRYRDDYDDEHEMSGRYSYRRGGGSRGGRM
jgi:hypothetical protein